MRTVWDGDRELAEIRVPVKLVDGTAVADTAIDNDLYLPRLSRTFHGYDPNPYFGRVVYTPGLELDQPLAITRYNYVDLGLPNATTTNRLVFSVVGGIGGGIAAGGCAIASAGICAAGSPFIVAGGSGIGATVGTLIGGAFDAVFAYKAGGRFTPKTKTIIDREATDATGQEATCEYCGIQTVPTPGSGRSRQYDHWDPRSKGGSSDPSNGRRSCATCNQGFGNRPKPDPRQPPEN